MRLAVVGLGSAGWTAARAVRRCAEFSDLPTQVELAAGADLKDAARQDFAAQFDVPAFGSSDEMYAAIDVDAAFICTPNPAHAPEALAAIAAGKHVLIEKPMATTLQACNDIVEAAKTAGVYAVAVHTPAYHPAIRMASDLVAEGTLGRLLQVTSLLHTPWLLRPRDPAELDSTAGGGVCFRQAPHQVDIVRAINRGSAVTAVHAVSGASDVVAPGATGHYSALLTFANGAAASLIYNGYGYFDTAELTWEIGMSGRARPPGAGVRLRRARVAERSKTVEAMDHARDIEESSRRRDRTYQPMYGLNLICCEGGDITQTREGLAVHGANGTRELRARPWSGPLVEELRDLAFAIAETREPLCDAAWGRETFDLCDQIQQSGESNEPSGCNN